MQLASGFINYVKTIFLAPDPTRLSFRCAENTQNFATAKKLGRFCQNSVELSCKSVRNADANTVATDESDRVS